MLLFDAYEEGDMDELFALVDVTRQSTPLRCVCVCMRHHSHVLMDTMYSIWLIRTFECLGRMGRHT